jgi:hypothetical protein
MLVLKVLSLEKVHEDPMGKRLDVSVLLVSIALAAGLVPPWVPCESIRLWP